MLTNATETSEKVRKLTPNLSATERNRKLKEMKQWLQTHYEKESTLSEQWKKNKKSKRIIQKFAFPPSFHEGSTAAIKNKTIHVTHYKNKPLPRSPPILPDPHCTLPFRTHRANLSSPQQMNTPTKSTSTAPGAIPSQLSPTQGLAQSQGPLAAAVAASKAAQGLSASQRPVSSQPHEWIWCENSKQR